MNKPVVTYKVRKAFQRISALFGAAALLLLVSGAAIVPAVSAVGAQVQSRKMILSDNRIGTNGGTNVSYDVYVSLASAYTMKGVIIDFCEGTGAGQSSPIIGTACQAPTGMSIGTPTFTSDTAASPNVDLSSWTAAKINSGRTFELSKSAGASVTASSTLHFTITGITNPTRTGTFYARFLTYTATADADGYTDTTPGAYQDYGGFALSTANPVTVTARVQETLTYCVSGTDISTKDTTNTKTGTCADATAPNLILGHGGTSATSTIDATQVDRGTAYSQISTNASQGAVVRMKNFNTCANGGLSSNGGTVCNINGIVGTGTPSGSVASDLVAGQTAFGVFISDGAATLDADNGNVALSTAGGAYAPDANYHVAAHSNETTPDLYYGMDQDPATGVTTTYGDIVATTSNLPCSSMNNHIVFGVTAGLTVPAGIYTATIDFIATGTF